MKIIHTHVFHAKGKGCSLHLLEEIRTGRRDSISLSWPAFVVVVITVTIWNVSWIIYSAWWFLAFIATVSSPFPSRYCYGSFQPQIFLATLSYPSRKVRGCPEALETLIFHSSAASLFRELLFHTTKLLLSMRSRCLLSFCSPNANLGFTSI